MKKILSIIFILLSLLSLNIVNIKAASLSEANGDIKYASNESLQITNNFYTIDDFTQNTVYGNWETDFLNYNCYAFAINRYEHSGYYTNLKKYQVGIFSNQVTYVKNNIYDVCIVSDVVIQDLTAIGAINPRKSKYIEELELTENDNLICVRTSDIDYHFMKYDWENNCWLHKPGFKHIMRFNDTSISLSDEEWIKESVDGTGLVEIERVHNLYKSEIIYIAYQDHKASLNCDTIISYNIPLNSNKDRMFKLNVQCEGVYEISISSDDDSITYEVLDEKMKGYYVLEPVCSLGYLITNKYSFDVGTMYIQIYYLNHYNDESININIRKISDIDTVYLGVENDLLEGCHVSSRDDCEFDYEFNNLEEGFYKFSMTGINNNGNLTSFIDGNYSILNEQFNYVTKFVNGSLINESFNEANENYIFVYLLANSKYYFRHNLNIEEIESLNLTIEKVNIQNINLFNYNSNDSTINILNSEISNEVLKGVHFEQSGKFELNFNSSNINTFNVYIFSVSSDAINNNITLNTIINSNNSNYSTDVKPVISLFNGTYYVYISYVGQNKSYDFSMKRKISTFDDDTLIPDPSFNDLCGSQINIAERDEAILSKTYGKNTILQGFSRVIYLSNGNSRHNYNWYSSNESIAIVTEYGTVLGISPGRVNIIAVDKINYDVIFIKEFIVSADTSTTTKTIRLSDEIEYSDTPYLLKLNAQNCPFPKFSYYNWSISVISEENSSFYGNINQWGYVKVSKECEVCIVGRYKFNDNYTVLYFLTVS